VLFSIGLVELVVVMMMFVVCMVVFVFCVVMFSLGKWMVRWLMNVFCCCGVWLMIWILCRCGIILMVVLIWLDVW